MLKCRLFEAVPNAMSPRENPKLEAIVMVHSNKPFLVVFRFVRKRSSVKLVGFHCLFKTMLFTSVLY